MEGIDERASDVFLKERVEEWAKKWREQRRGAVGELVPEEFVLHSGRIGGATKLAGVGAQSWVIHGEGRWASQAFMGCVGSNMEDPLCVSRVAVGRTGVPCRQLRHGAR